MKLPIVLVICSCLGIFEFCGACGANMGAQTTQAPASSKISTRLSSRVNQFTIGQHVMVTLTIKNISNQNVPLRTDLSYYRVYVEGAKGEADKTRFYHRLRGEFLPGESELRGGGVTLEIQPGKSGIMKFDLTQYYKLQEAGEYRVYIDCDDEAGTWVRSNNVLTLTLIGSAQATKQSTASFTLSISTDEDSVRTGDEIRVDAEVTNTSNHEIVYDNAMSKLDIQVRDAQGNLAALTESGRSYRKDFGRPGSLYNLFHIKPGDTLRTGAAIVQMLYDMSRPGDYTIQVLHFDDETKTWVKSNTITVTAG